MSKVFDPIGLVVPFTVGARLLLKDIWRVSGQHWDEELPKDTVERFPNEMSNYPSLPKSLYNGATFLETLNIWNYTFLALVLK